MDIEVFPPDKLIWFDQTCHCVLGWGSVCANKYEGDGVTPVGRWPLRSDYYRPDRISRPNTLLPTQALKPEDGWCDDPKNAAYNQHIKKPFAASYEDLWREDGVYDLFVVLGHNDSPIQPDKGSAIFMHVVKPDLSPTEGCVALALDDLVEILKSSGPETAIVIHPAR